MLKRNSSTPLYVQLANLLREQISTGEIKVGDKLPSEAEMIKIYKLGRLTIRDALSILANEGLVEKQHGKGTFCKACIHVPKYRIDVLLDLTNIYFVLPYYLRAISEVLDSEDVNIILSDTKNDDEKICQNIERAISEGTDGVLFQPSFISDVAGPKLISLLATLREKDIPYIMMDGQYENVPLSFAAVDDFNSGTIAARYFQSLGHKELCMIELQEYHNFCKRKAGFCEALDTPPHIVSFDEHTQGADDLTLALAELFQKHPGVTGIFCYNDAIAQICYEALSKLNKKVGEDISVMGVDDTIIASALSPGLTSVVHPKGQLAKETAEAMLAILSGQSSWPYQKLYEPSLSIRKSCRAL